MQGVKSVIVALGVTANGSGVHVPPAVGRYLIEYPSAPTTPGQLSVAEVVVTSVEIGVGGLQKKGRSIGG